MKDVSRFEADLLRLLHATLGLAPIEGVLPLIAARRERPTCLSRQAVGLIQDALAKGFLWRLAREGSWRRDRHLRGGRVAAGRLWERTPPEDLAPDFSRDSLNFLLWLACDHPADAWRPSLDALTAGDQFLMFAAYEALRATTFGAPLRKSAPFRTHGLCRLAFPEDFLDAPDGTPPDLAPWTTGLRSCIFEALQPRLAALWLELEMSKIQFSDPARLSALGRSQGAVVDALLSALDASGRRDLARFLLDAAGEAFRRDRGGKEWIDPQLLSGLRRADRARIGRSALTLLTTLDRLRSWERDARSVGYFDDGYAAAQLWKSDWESRDGVALSERAGAVLRRLDPLGA